VNLTFW